MATFTNQATLTYNGQTTTSNVTVGELTETLTAAKTAVVPTYGTDGRVTYILSLVNSGTAPLTGLTITDDLGGYTFNAGTVYPLSYTAGSVRYYQNGVLQAASRRHRRAAADVHRHHRAGRAAMPLSPMRPRPRPSRRRRRRAPSPTARPSPARGWQTPLPPRRRWRPEAAPALTINKSLSPTTVTENSRLTYTFTIQNTGNTAADAAAAIVITDTFDPRLTDLTVTLNGTALTAPTQYTYDAATGVFATVAGVVTVPAATFTQDAATGAYSTTPGTAVLTVTGTV